LIQTWKAAPVLKGLLTRVPILDTWRRHHATSGGTDSSRYCYSVWLRHLTTLNRYGFKISGSRIGELGPGDSIGIGIAALLSGASHYVGLDIVPFSAKINLQTIFEELVDLYSRRERIPDHNEFPRVRPRLESYEFSDYLIDWENFAERTESIHKELRNPNIGTGQFVDYKVPWTSHDQVAAASLDLIFSQAVLEHVDGLEETYNAMSLWLKPGGYASHVIDFTAHGLAPFWNGHWAYSDWEWKSVRGCREYLLNRQPLSRHLFCASLAGFEVVHAHRDYGERGLGKSALSQQFQTLNDDDLRTRGAVLILRKY
jgi:SAM-dependent methyltransferase